MKKFKKLFVAIDVILGIVTVATFGLNTQQRVSANEQGGGATKKGGFS